MSSTPLTAFGDARGTTLTPVLGWEFEYNINSHLILSTTTGSGTVTQSHAKAVLQTNAATASSAKIKTVKQLSQAAGLGLVIRFGALFTTGAAGSTQIIGFGDEANGCFFGFNGASFGVMHRQNSVDMWVADTDWNGQQLPGYKISDILDPTKGNIFAIQIQSIGFGTVNFIIYDPSCGIPFTVHTFSFSNISTDPSVYNLDLPLMAEVSNTTNNTNIKLETPAATVFTEGTLTELTSMRNEARNILSGLTSESAILTIKSKSTFSGILNNVCSVLDTISVATDGTKPVTLRLIKDTTLGGAPSYTDVDTNSVMQYDTAGTTVSGGSTETVLYLGKSESQLLTIKNMEINVLPGHTLTFAVYSSASTDVYLNVSWIEKF